MDAYENELGWLNPEYCPKLDRIVVCLDMDEFRVQVEEFEDVDVGIWQQQYRPIVVATQSSKRLGTISSFLITIILTARNNNGSIKLLGFNIYGYHRISLCRLLSVNYAARRLGIKPANEEKRTVDDLIYEYGYAGLKVHYPKMRYGREDMFTPEKYMNNVYNALENYRQKLANPNSIIIEWAKMEEIYVDVTGLVRQRYGPWGRPPAESPVLALCHSFKNYPNWDAPRTVLEDKHGPLSGWMLEEKISDWDYCADVGKRLIHGGVIANAIVNDIKKDTGMKASAGVSHTKLLSRLACQMNKPQGTTILSFPGFVRLSSEIKIGRIHGYGQSLAEKLAERYFNDHGIRLETFADVQKLSGGAIYDLQGVFLDVFPGIRQITAQQKAEKLVKNCHGNDNQVVQCSSFFKKTMEASASIPSGKLC